ncbi:glycosyltransferase family 4 protein [Akkermansiaceae bacterium]|nr:glycosyltransferase family 4 protein [Akkermansiaceae bacterium]
MKIIFIVTGLPSINEPARSRFNYKYAKALADKGHDVEVFYLRSINPKRKLVRRTSTNNLNVLEFSLTIPFIKISLQSFFFRKLFNFVLRFKKISADVIQGSGGATAIAANIVSKRINKPYFIQYIGTDLNYDIKYLINNTSYKNSINECSHHGFESRALQDIFTSYFPHLENNSVLYRGIGDYDYNYRLGYEVQVLFLGGFPYKNDIKGGELLLKAIKLLDSKNLSSNVCFNIGGPEVPDLSIFSKSIKNNKIRINSLGAISHRQVIQELQKSNILLIPSRAEGLPNVLWEGLATGNLVIANKVGGITEILSMNDCGYLLNSISSNSISEAIASFINERWIVEDFAFRGREVVERFNYKKFINNNISILRRISAK